MLAHSEVRGSVSSRRRPGLVAVALFMVRAGRLAARTLTIIVIAPLVISVVVRTYGWQVILGSGPNGVLNFYGPGPHLRTSALF
jgi:hypothetical protein